MAKKGKGWKTALVVGLSVLTVAGVGALGFALFNPSETKEVKRSMWSVGGIDATGAYSKTVKTSIVTDLFGCDGLDVDIAENEFKGSYSVYYYTLNGNFLSSIENLSADKNRESLELPMAATCRIVYTPQLEKNDKIYFWEVGGFADDMKITYNRVQESVLDKCAIPEKTTGAVYSMVEYDGELYAGIGGKTLLTSVNGRDWKSVGNEPFDKGVIIDLVVYDDVLYGVNSENGVFAYDKKAVSDGDNNSKFIMYEGEYEGYGDETATYYSLHADSIWGLEVLNGELFAFGAHDSFVSAGYMSEGVYKRRSISGANVYKMIEPGCWEGLSSPGDGESLRDAVYVDGNYIFVGLNGGVFRTTDLAQWYDYTNVDFGTILSVYHDGTNFVFGCEGGKIYAGTNIENMHKAVTNSKIVVGAVKMIRGYDGNLYAVAYSDDGAYGEIWKSEDHGATWRVIVDGYEGFYSLSVMRGELYVGGVNNIYSLGNLK